MDPIQTLHLYACNFFISSSRVCFVTATPPLPVALLLTKYLKTTVVYSTVCRNTFLSY